MTGSGARLPLDMAGEPLQWPGRRPGSVWFATRKHRFGDEISRTVIGTTPYGFDRIPDAREVYKRMRSLQTEAS